MEESVVVCHGACGLYRSELTADVDDPKVSVKAEPHELNLPGARHKHNGYSEAPATRSPCQTSSKTPSQTRRNQTMRWGIARIGSESAARERDAASHLQRMAYLP
jgi:hypothetical protein